MARMRALSIRQPYAEQIMQGCKTREYRSMPTRIRERVYIYASKTPGDADEFADMGLTVDELPRGVLIGTVEITGCRALKSGYAWQLARPQRLAEPVTPANPGQPKFFYPFPENDPRGEDSAVTAAPSEPKLEPPVEPTPESTRKRKRSAKPGPDRWLATQKGR